MPGTHNHHIELFRKAHSSILNSFATTSRILPRFTETHPEEAARTLAGDDAVYYNAKLRGASNEKARKLLNFKPRRLQWL